MLVVNADADFRSHRNTCRPAHGHHAVDDLSEQVGFPWKRRTATAPGDLGHRTTEVQIDMVGHIVVNDDARRLLDDRRIDPIQLQGTDFLARCETAQAQGFGIASHECTGGNHFGDIQAVRPVLFADHAERPIGHPGHRGQHDRRRHMDAPQVHGMNLHRTGGRRGTGIFAESGIATLVDDVLVVLAHTLGFLSRKRLLPIPAHPPTDCAGAPLHPTHPQTGYAERLPSITSLQKDDVRDSDISTGRQPRRSSPAGSRRCRFP